jgi:hypothetical protein
MGDDLITTKTPAVTIVAACINAETGVGPSIASGNQVCKPSCADLPMAPKNKKKQIKSILSKENHNTSNFVPTNKYIKLKTVPKSKLLKKKNINNKEK